MSANSGVGGSRVGRHHRVTRHAGEILIPKKYGEGNY